MELVRLIVLDWQRKCFGDKKDFLRLKLGDDLRKQTLDIIILSDNISL